MKNHNKFLLIIFFYSLLAGVFGLWHVSHGNFSAPSLPFILLGIYAWTDALILGFFLAAACAILWRMNNKIWTGLFFSSYVLVRAFIELLYWLNLQFTAVTRPWEPAWFAFIPTEYISLMDAYIFGQLFYTIIVITSLLIFLKFLKQYLKAN